MYFLQNTKAGYLGNSPMWWAKSGSYTARIDEAQEFGEEEADAIISSTKGSHNFRKWSVADVLAVAHRTVDVQDLRKNDRT